MSLTHIKPGDKLAIPADSRAWSHVPHVTNHIVLINRVTATQLVGSWINGSEVRVNRETGKVIGRDYARAKEVTPEIMAQHKAEVDECQRWRTAVTNTNDLIGRPLHQLKLTTAQLERLAAAWAEVKAMESNT